MTKKATRPILQGGACGQHDFCLHDVQLFFPLSTPLVCIPLHFRAESVTTKICRHDKKEKNTRKTPCKNSYNF